MAIAWWTTDSLKKIFPDSSRPVDAPQAIELWAARNETEDAQVAIPVPKDKRVEKASFSFTPLRGPRGAKITSTNAHWEWFTWVHANPPENTDPSTYLRKAPAFFPDAFLEDPEVGLRGGVTQPLWVSVKVPEDAAPGDYKGSLTIDLRFRNGAVEKFTVPLILHVWPFALPRMQGLHHTEFMYPSIFADWYNVPEWSDAHWAWIKAAAKDMAAHRQDTILTAFSDLVRVRESARGSLSFDFSLLDRWLDIFQSAGLPWVEGGYIAGRTGGWTSKFGFNRWSPTGPDGKPVDTSRSKMSERQFARYAEALAKACHAHLGEKGLAARYIQHVADEPLPENEDSWKAIASQVRKWLPGVPRIDAIMSHGLEGFCELRVPQIQEIKERSSRKAPEALWTYVCLAPQTIYPNRFVDYPSLRNRMIYWLCFTLNLKGFLHWAYNYWRVWGGVPVNVPISPWTDTTGGSIYNVDTQPLPAGDTHIVYPGKRSICSSIRWEVIRKGYEDFELLKLLESAVRAPARKSSPAVNRGKALLDRVRTEIALDPARHTHDDKLLLNVRREAGDILSRL